MVAAGAVEEAAGAEDGSAAADSPGAAPALAAAVRLQGLAAGAPSEQDMSEEVITAAGLSAPVTAVGATQVVAAI